jgi:hypothetical protein
MDRRKFLQLLSGAGVSAAVAASAGFDLSHFLSWLTRQPRWSFPSQSYSEFVEMTGIAEATAATELIPELALPSLKRLMTIYYDRKVLKRLEENICLDYISEPRTFPDGSKAVKFGNIWKPVIETKKGLLVV